MSAKLNDFCCTFCNLELDPIFIKCGTCSTDFNQNFQFICLACFSNGLENQVHKNTHSYRVINMNDVKTFDGFNLLQELKIINKMAEFHEICHFRRDQFTPSEYLLNFDSLKHEECVNHFENWLNLLRQNLDEQLDPNRVYKSRLKTTMVLLKDLNTNESIAHANRCLTSNLSLLRPQFLSKQYKQMNGYRPARSDFETEYNDKFELEYLADLDFECGYSSSNDLSSSESSEIEIEEEIEDAEESFEEDYKLENSLKLELLRSYNDLLRERDKRKRFVRQLGLMTELAQSDFALTLLVNKSTSNCVTHNFLPKQKLNTNNNLIVQDCFSHLQKLKYESEWRPTKKMHRLFADYESLAKCVELFNHQAYLRKKIQDLNECRQMGIKSLTHVGIYKHLKLKRLNKTPNVHLGSLLTLINRYDESNASTFYCKALCQDWFKKFALSDQNFKPKYLAQSSSENKPAIESARPVSAYPASHLKYKNNPLKIENYPDWEKLDEDEKEFCRIARVQPTVYLRVKAVLILENTKAGFVSYARARKIAGIDVNKCRLIHSLMLKLELIRASATNQANQIEQK